MAPDDLRQSDLTAGILNALPVGILALDQNGVVIQANHQAASLAGRPLKNLPGLSVADFWPRSAEEIAAFARSRRQAATLTLPELDNCFVQATPLAQRRGLVLTILDQRLWRPYHGAGPTLDPLTPYYKQIFNSSSDGITVTDKQGRIILINESAAANLDVQPEDMQGRDVNYLIERGLSSDVVAHEVIRTRQPVTKISKYLRTNKHILLTGTPIFTREGQIRLVVINERDMTTLFELQTSLKQHKSVLARFKDELRTLHLAELTDNEMVAQSQAMRLTLEAALKLSRHGVPQILISGESGTGKGLLAKFIHANSPNAAEPFIQISCAALPETMLEAELFGYERGAFAGADPEGRAGLFEAAGRGTAFLDDISEMPPATQAKILTFLDNREFRRLAGRRTITAACTVIAATNQDLERMAARKRFRSDLYYRLNAFSLQVAPLRERPEDVIELARREVEKQNERYGLRRELDQETLELLTRASFPGNVRQLLNSLNQAALLSDGPSLAPYLSQALAAESRRGDQAPEAGTAPGNPEPAVPEPAPPAPAARLSDKLAETEKAGLAAALSRCRSTREMAALLGISQAGVSRKLKKYGLKPPR